MGNNAGRGAVGCTVNCWTVLEIDPVVADRPSELAVENGVGSCYRVR